MDQTAVGPQQKLRQLEPNHHAQRGDQAACRAFIAADLWPIICSFALGLAAADTAVGRLG